jgi:phosphate transport system substrate-binding protein
MEDTIILNKNKMLKRGWLTVALMSIIAVVVIVTGCGSDTTTATPASTAETGYSGTFSVIGSNTVTPLTAVWAENFMAANTKVNIAVSGPGSGAGIAALINDTTDICQASRSIKQKEIDQAGENGIDPYETVVALDALSVIVHPNNPVSELSIVQISAIYTNQITNWKELGGDDAPIVVLSRDTNSGTHVYFKEEVVQMAGLTTEDETLEYGPDVLLLPSTEEGVIEVAQNPNAIFYPGLGYVTDEVKTIAIKKTDSDPGVLPSVSTALDGTYPIARSLYYYTDGEPEGVIKAFIDYCLTDEGQAVVLEVGYVPLK